MKYTLAALAALASAAKACVVGGDTVSCPTKTINGLVANFDDRNSGVEITEYHYLNFNNLTVEHQGDGPRHRGVTPHSKPNYGVGYVNFRADLSLEGTKTTSFDFTNAWVGCIAESGTSSGHKSVACKIAIDCPSNLSFEGHFGPQLYEYAPSGPNHAGMMFVDPGFTYCQEISITLWDAAEAAYVVVDDILYNIREGECLPTEPGGANPSC